MSDAAGLTGAPPVTGPAGQKWWRHRQFVPVAVLSAVLLIALVSRVYRLDAPPDTLIFDEHYYVHAARIILGLPVAGSAPYAFRPPGIDPNAEHPPLGKVLIAGSIGILGDHAFGWRAPSVIAGLASVLLLYGVVRIAGGDAWLAVLAATVYSLDNLVIVHSRIATLDIFVVALLMLAVWFYLGGSALGAGIAGALAALVKVNAVFGILALLLVEGILLLAQRRRTGTRQIGALRQSGLLLAGFVPVWIAGLWLLDALVGSFRTPWDHLAYMISYGVTFAEGTVSGNSHPWQWLANEVQLPYLRLTQPVEVDGRVIGQIVTVHFRGAMTPLIIGAAPLGIAYAIWRVWSTGDRLSAWVVAWVLGLYGVYYPLDLISSHFLFLYYMLPVLPAVCVAIAQLLRQSGLPAAVTWAYVAVVAVGAVVYYPFQPWR